MMQPPKSIRIPRGGELMEKGDTIINIGPVDVALSYRAEIMPDQA